MQFTIKELRRAKGISLEEMADYCGVHVNTYRAWEEKPSEIKLSMAKKIADKFRIDIKDVDFMP